MGFLLQTSVKKWKGLGAIFPKGIEGHMQNIQQFRAKSAKAIGWVCSEPFSNYCSHIVEWSILIDSVAQNQRVYDLNQ